MRAAITAVALLLLAPGCSRAPQPPPSYRYDVRGGSSGLQQGQEKVLVAFYTAAGNKTEASRGKEFTQCMAYSTDGGNIWKRYADNPVLQHVRGENRDPKVVWHEQSKRWIMVLYLGGNEFAFFNSPDLKNWKMLHTLTVPGCGECPDFFPMQIDGEKDASKWVWTAANAHYLLGDFDGERFKPDSPAAQRIDFGKNYYAVQTYSDAPDGRR